MFALGAKAAAWAGKSVLMQSPIGGFLKRHRRIILIALAVAVAFAVALIWHGRQVKAFGDERYRAGVAFEHAAHLQTIANYRAAAERARQLDAANAARVRAEQSKINQETKDAFQKRLADARARADRLRRASSATNPGRGGTASMSGVPAPAERPTQASGQDGLSLDDRLTATEQAIQLDELIKWVRRQANVDVNGEPDK